MITPQDLVAARLYDTEAEVVQDALRHLLRARADLRLSLAIHRFQARVVRPPVSPLLRSVAGCS